MKDMTLSQWNNTITTNLTSTFLVIRAFLRQLDGQSEEAKRNVAVVLIGSTAGKYGEAGTRAHEQPTIKQPPSIADLVFNRTCGLRCHKIGYDGRHHAFTQE